MLVIMTIHTKLICRQCEQRITKVDSNRFGTIFIHQCKAGDELCLNRNINDEK